MLKLLEVCVPLPLELGHSELEVFPKQHCEVMGYGGCQPPFRSQGVEEPTAVRRRTRITVSGVTAGACTEEEEGTHLTTTSRTVSRCNEIGA